MVKRNVLKGVCITVFLFVSGLGLCYPILLKGYLMGFDSPAHLLWAQQFLKSVNAGIIYPQWVGDANLGCGNATFIFYPPVTFFTYSVINFFTKDVLEILSVSAIFGIFISGIAMYIFCRTHLSRFASMLSALAYMALPYHLADLYIRSALAELWAFVWLPTACFFLEKIRERTVPYAVGLSLSYAGLILTHLPTALLFSPFLVLYSAFLHYRDKNSVSSAYRLFALFCGVGLSSFYLIPAVFEQQYVNIGALTRSEWSWLDNNFLFSGTAVNFFFNRRISKIAVSAVLVSFASMIFPMRRKGGWEISLSHKSFFAISGILSFILILSPTKILWDVIPYLKQVQFPWRLLTITTFFSSISMGFICEHLFDPNFFFNKRFARVLLGLVAASLVSLNGLYSFDIIASFKGFSFDYVKSLVKQNWSIRSDSPNDEIFKNFNLYFIGNVWLIDVSEYRPLWSVQEIPGDIAHNSGPNNNKVLESYIGYVRRKIAESPHADLSTEEAVFYEKRGTYVLFPPPKILESIHKSEALIMIPRDMLKEKVIFKEGRGLLKIINWGPEIRTILVDTTRPGKILVKTFYYPRWSAFTKSEPLSVTPDSRTGLIELAIPKGKYEIELKFKAGAYRKAGILISLAFVGMIILILLRKDPRSSGHSNRRII